MDENTATYVWHVGKSKRMFFLFLTDFPSIQTAKRVEVSEHEEFDVDTFLPSLAKSEMTQRQCPCVWWTWHLVIS